MQKSFLLKLDGSAHERLAAAAAARFVHADLRSDAIDTAVQEDKALALAAQALAGYHCHWSGTRGSIIRLESTCRLVR